MPIRILFSKNNKEIDIKVNFIDVEKIRFA
jgi:hypothetical protein